jgi:hypothetical protein
MTHYRSGGTARLPSRRLPTRTQKRWSGRLRTAGALLLLAGAVGLVDKLLPGGAQPEWPGWVQPAAAALLVAVGGGLFFLGGRWR